MSRPRATPQFFAVGEVLNPYGDGQGPKDTGLLAIERNYLVHRRQLQIREQAERREWSADEPARCSVMQVPRSASGGRTLMGAISSGRVARPDGRAWRPTDPRVRPRLATEPIRHPPRSPACDNRGAA